MPRIHLTKLVEALEHFGNERYITASAFRDDIEEFSGTCTLAEQHLCVGAKHYVCRVVAGGVVRLFRVPTPPEADQIPAPTGPGPDQREYCGKILVLLIGFTLECAPDIRHIFPLALDPISEQWKAYTGPFLGWMKECLSWPITE